MAAAYALTLPPRSARNFRASALTRRAITSNFSLSSEY